MREEFLTRALRVGVLQAARVFHSGSLGREASGHMEAVGHKSARATFRCPGPEERLWESTHLHGPASVTQVERRSGSARGPPG